MLQSTLTSTPIEGLQLPSKSGAISAMTRTLAKVVFKTLDRRRKHIDARCAEVAPVIASS
jgi:hypothetical protein